ncbi:isochorismatase family protein [Crucibulum laeve]|uniref:Isochorismatase family protein n=1 Tax=Crucibulum laeve TaxID=68775 RepID=A0A5C3MDD6_9AGAR|nr:isochorismatase family protein [Crucibulum laeve]
MMQIDSYPYNWPCSGQLSSKNTALVVIDMQIDFCSPVGYLAHQGYNISQSRAPIPHIASLLCAFREAGYPIFHTREGHRSDLSDLTERELSRSRNNPTGLGIGDTGPLGRLLVRGEPGHDIIPEVYPLPGEPIIDKPGRSAFIYTDFELLLKVKDIRNLVICGLTTDLCVSSTMREASDRGYDCLIVSDACGATMQKLHESAVEMMGTEGGIFGAIVQSARQVVEAIGTS